MAVAELKQASSQSAGELSSELPKNQGTGQQADNQLSSELPVPRSRELASELSSELLSQSPTRTSDADFTLNNALVNEEALLSISQQLSGSPSLSADIDSTSPTTDAPISEKALAATSELPSESTGGTPYLDLTLTKATVSDDALAPNNKEVAAQNPSRLTGVALARRLGVAPGSISRNKQKENFAAWTSLHDPDGISWQFDGQTFQKGSDSPTD